MDSQARSNALDKIPLRRFGTPAEIAEAALFLASNEYANNCVINLDGGLSAAVSALGGELAECIADNSTSYEVCAKVFVTRRSVKSPVEVFLQLLMRPMKSVVGYS
jgi:hypothetical protein